MNVSAMFKRKVSRRVRPAGMTQAELDAIDKEFDDAMEPLGIRATEYFQEFWVNGQRRAWLLPGGFETYKDVPVEKKRFVLKFKDYFLKEIAAAVMDDVSYGD